VRPAPTDPSFMQWERCDDMVTSWILNSLSPELRDSLQYVNNTKKVHISRDLTFHEKIFPFVIAPDGSCFNSILQMIIHTTKMPCMSGQINTFANDERLDNITPYEVTDNQVINST